jgi:methylmalonyl-CoA mutase N-terminal domain/subunit
VEAVQIGFPQQEIQEASYRHQRDLEEKKTIVVGVNVFETKEDAVQGPRRRREDRVFKVDESVELLQVERLKVLRAERNNAAAVRAVNALRDAAPNARTNLIPYILEAVKSEATLGEISDALRDVFGEYREHVVL